MKNLQVYLPYQKYFISQRFGENANISYSRDGLAGHTAYDWSIAYGTPIPNCTANAYCYSVMNKDSKDPSRYRAAFFLVETDTGIYEVSYGHMSTILAEPGTTYQVGETIGLVGNTGIVFTGSHEVTKEERLAGSHAGFHLHGPQLRPVKKSKTTKSNKVYLYDENGRYTDKDGMFYEVLDYNNGYNGCVNPFRPFSTETLATDYKPASDVVPLYQAEQNLVTSGLEPDIIKMALAILRSVYKRLTGR
jgi:hypothetical protein